MLEIYIKLLPVFAFFLFGVLLKYFQLAKENHGALLLKIMFFVTLPVLVLVKLTEATLTTDKITLPFINIAVNLLCLMVMFFLTRKSTLEDTKLGVMLLCSMVMNNFFLFLFILAVLGEAALVEAMIFDIGNAITTMTLAYAIAFLHGPEKLKTKNIVLNIFKLPALWALVIAISMNLNLIHFSVAMKGMLEPIGLLTNPLILISLGIYFSPRLIDIQPLVQTIGVRMVLGLILGIIFVYIFNLSGISAAIVVLCCSAPIGFNGLTFSALAKLDMELASSAVSASIFIGLFTIPLLLYFVQIWLKI